MSYVEFNSVLPPFILRCAYNVLQNKFWLNLRCVLSANATCINFGLNMYYTLIIHINKSLINCIFTLLNWIGI